MFKKSVYALRIASVLLIASIIFYVIEPETGKYILGVGLVCFSIATILYIFFMFKRYGEKETIS